MLKPGPNDHKDCWWWKNHTNFWPAILSNPFVIWFPSIATIAHFLELCLQNQVLTIVKWSQRYTSWNGSLNHWISFFVSPLNPLMQGSLWSLSNKFSMLKAMSHWQCSDHWQAKQDSCHFDATITGHKFVWSLHHTWLIIAITWELGLTKQITLLSFRRDLTRIPWLNAAYKLA